MQSALKLDHLDEVQRKRYHWAKDKRVAQSKKPWSLGVKDKQAKGRSNVLPFPPRKTIFLQQRWLELASKLQDIKISLSEVKIKLLIEKGNISQARKELSVIPLGTSRPLDKWKRLFADPIVTRGAAASGKNFRRDFDWIEQNSSEYKGLWIAIKDGKLLGNNRSRVVLERELGQLQALEGATFFKVEE